VLKIGHRGAPAYEPENTLRSFGKAVEMGVDAVELDVRKTKDGRIVVVHDAEVDRTTDGEGRVSELTLEEIKQLTAEKGEKIPTLEEALDFLNGKVKILIELKETGLEKDVLNLIHQKGLDKNVVIVSFLEEALGKIRELSAEVETGLIYVRHAEPIGAALELRASYLLPFYRFTSAADIQRAHENGLKVIVWTINEREKIVEYAKRGVDGIASDRPDVLKGLHEGPCFLSST
jgi:glycerophosphoryl diester phosphodiesterase